MQPPAEYRLPAIRIGDPVYWFETPKSTEPTLAFVTRVADQSVDLTLIVNGAQQPDPKGAVRWRKDPRQWGAQSIEDGCFDFIPKVPDGEQVSVTQVRAEFEDHVASLRLRIQALEAAQAGRGTVTKTS
jgi:hypothetical protein